MSDEIKDEVLDNDDKLEDANLVFFEEYREVETPIVVNEKANILFEKRESMTQVVDDALTRKDEILKQLKSDFGEEYKTKEGRASTDSAEASKSTVTTSTSTATSSASSTFGVNSANRTYGTTVQANTKSIFQDAEERAVKFSEKASKSAKDVEDVVSRKRNKKKSFIDKIAPKGTKRKKALIITAAIAVETIVSGLFLMQGMAKRKMYENMEGAFNGKDK